MYQLTFIKCTILKALVLQAKLQVRQIPNHENPENCYNPDYLTIFNSFQQEKYFIIFSVLPNIFCLPHFKCTEPYL